MGKSYSRSLIYTPVAGSDSYLPVLNEITSVLNVYYVLFTDLVSAKVAVQGAYRNFSQAFRACRSLPTGSLARCFFKGAAAVWQAVNPAKMPH